MIRERPPQSSVVALLEVEGLPASDLTEAHLQHFFFIGTDGMPSALAHVVRALYLLTATAESFFEHRGYRRIDRAKAPSAIQSTREFASLCPASSAFMIKQL
jgi:hypothetical protein